MAILKNPLFSLKASGPITKVLSFCRRKNVNIVEKTPVVKDAHSPAQVYHRNMFGLCVDLWHTLSAAEKQVWESAGTARHMTGYAWYISQCLRPNPGIYLPLAGGTMSGDIDMDAHRVLDLPAPLAAQEPVRKTELTTHTATPAAHHARYTAGEVESAIRAIVTTPGAILLPGIGDSLTQLPIGTDDQVLTVDTSVEPARMKWATPTGEGHITIIPFNYSAIIQGTFIFDNQPSQWSAFAFRTTAAANSDEIHYLLFLEAGTYTLRLNVIKTGSAGIIDVYLDAVEIASFDTYAGAPAFNQIVTDTGNVVATRGIKTLKLKIDGKNALATDHRMYVSQIALWRTA